MPRQHRRLYLDQFTDSTGEPLLRMRAIETGMHTHRGLTVAPLHLVILEVTDAYEPRRIDAYRTPADALAAARRVTAEPDSRGQMRDWVDDDGQPHGAPMIPGGYF